MRVVRVMVLVVAIAVAGAMPAAADEGPAAVFGVVTDSFDGDLAEAVEYMGYQVRRLAGASRIETATEVAETLDDRANVLLTTTAERFFDGPEIVGVARRDAFPDALAGGANGGRHGGPLLLTYTDAVAPEAWDYLCACRFRS